MDELGVVGVEPLLDRGQRRRRPGDADPEVRLRQRRALERASISACDVAGERLELGRLGGSWVMWRSVWRTVPACSEA